jgi:hypothetical protein
VRNLVVYPITHEEKISSLKKAIERAMEDGGVGDIEPVALSEILEELERQTNPITDATVS